MSHGLDADGSGYIVGGFGDIPGVNVPSGMTQTKFNGGNFGQSLQNWSSASSQLNTPAMGGGKKKRKPKAKPEAKSKTRKRSRSRRKK